LTTEEDSKRAAEEKLMTEAAKEHGMPIAKIYEWAAQQKKQQQKQEQPDR
jgi:hypothetical protein